MTAARPEASVLVVDDEEQIRRLISVVLTRYVTRYHVQVTEAASAEEALAAIELADFDLIITDYSMPGKTGIDLLDVAHHKMPRGGRLLITALTQLDIGVEAINRGHVDGFLRKPWDNAAFVALVDTLLEPRVSQHQALPESLRSTTGSLSAEDKKKLQHEKEELDKQIGQLRVRLGLGAISPDGYRRVSQELLKRRAELELTLLQTA